MYLKNNAPLHGGKGYIYEGGIREPWIMWMPAMVKTGKQDNTLVTTDDIFNTCMQLAGASNKSPDGVSLVPLLENKKLADRNYYLHFPHYSPQHGKPGAVVRSGNYKLIEWYEDGKLELYDLQNDAAEKNNIAANNNALVVQLKKALDDWRKNIGAKMPEPNPNYIGD